MIATLERLQTTLLKMDPSNLTVMFAVSCNTATTNASSYAKVVQAIPSDRKELTMKRGIYINT